MSAPEIDVIVGGNAELCSAIAASDQGARVLVLERAPEAQRQQRLHRRRHAHGADGIETALTVVLDLSEAEKANTDFGRYLAEQYLDDLGRLTQYYCDADRAEMLVNNSTSTVQWLHSKRVRFLLRSDRGR